MMSKFVAQVKGVFIADDPETFVTRPLGQIDVELGGIPDDRHFGLLRPADSRQKIYKRGIMIANRRQISIVSLEECEQIAANLGLPEIRPEWLGANLLISGFPQLTSLSQGARLLFPNGTGLISEGENLPCVGPGNVISSIYEQPELVKKFVPAARKLRGIVCSVEREGIITCDDSINIYLPE
ncbi:MOSC domain-containing protein [Brevibacillus ginsengisoli]|uniref:MOSC domain-containing protein n=1 Tax=Brevibacillus ginsengisoli TaxID=363854 RepID=UPI003CF59EF6